MDGVKKENTFYYVVYKYGSKWYVWDTGMIPNYAITLFGENVE